MIIFFICVPLFLVSVSAQQASSYENPYFDENLKRVRFDRMQKNGIPCPRRRSMNDNTPLQVYGPAAAPSLKWRATHSLEEEKAKFLGLPIPSTPDPIAPDESVQKFAYPDPNQQQSPEVQNVYTFQQEKQRPKPAFPDSIREQVQSMFGEKPTQQLSPMFPDILNQQQQPSFNDQANKQQQQPLAPMFPDIGNQQQQSTLQDANQPNLQSMFPDVYNEQQQPTFQNQNPFADRYPQQTSTFQEQNYPQKPLTPTYPNTVNQQQLSVIPEVQSQATQSVFPQAKAQQRYSSPEVQQSQLPTIDSFYQNLPGYLFPEKNTQKPHLYPVKDIRTPQSMDPDILEGNPDNYNPGNYNNYNPPPPPPVPLSPEKNKPQPKLPDPEEDDAKQLVLRSGNIPDKPDENQENAYLHVHDPKIGLNADEISKYLGFHRSADITQSDPNPSQTYMNELTTGIKDNQPQVDPQCALPENDFDPLATISRKSLTSQNDPLDHKLTKKSSDSKFINDQEQRRDTENKAHVETRENIDKVESKKSKPIMNTRRQLLEPTKGLDVYKMPDTNPAIMEGSRVCYACTTVTDPTCWQPDRKTTVKYCREGHRACVTRTYKFIPDNDIDADLIVVRDCSSSCEEGLDENQPHKYESCSVCQNDLCNIQSIENGAFSLNSINVFVLVITGLSIHFNFG